MTRKTGWWLLAAGSGVVVVAVAVMVLEQRERGAGSAEGSAATQEAGTQDAGAAGAASATAASQRVRVRLLDEAMFKLAYIEPASQYTLKEGVLRVHNTTGTGPGFVAYFGGATLDNYRVSLEFRVTEPGSHDNWKGGFSGNVQISPNSCAVFCQVFRGGACNIAYFDGKFHHVDQGGAEVKPSDWNTVTAEVEEGFAMMTVNGKRTRSGDMPIGTAGALALLVNFSSDATTEIRNVELELLAPTAEQRSELETAATQPKKAVE